MGLKFLLASMRSLTILSLAFGHVFALPELHRRQDSLPIDPKIVAQVEDEFGALPWLTEREHHELVNGALDKRQSSPWAGPCGNGQDGYYYISGSNRVSQMRCSYVWSPVQNVIGGGLIVYRKRFQVLR